MSARKGWLGREIGIHLSGNEVKIRLAHARSSAVTKVVILWISLFAFAKNKLNKSLGLLNTSLWMWELDTDGGFGEPNPSLWKQLVQEDAWHIAYRERKTNKYTWHMAIGECPYWTLGDRHQASQAIVVRAYLLKQSAAENHITVNCERWSSQR